MVVLTKADDMRQTIRTQLPAQGLAVTDENVEHELEKRVEEKRKELNAAEGWSALAVDQSK